MAQGASVNKQDLESIATSPAMSAPPAFVAAVQAMTAAWPMIVQMDQQLLKQRAMEGARELCEQLPCPETRAIYDAALAWLAPPAAPE